MSYKNDFHKALVMRGATMSWGFTKEEFEERDRAVYVALKICDYMQEFGMTDEVLDKVKNEIMKKKEND